MDNLQHHGVLGMKWGVRKDRKMDYKSTSIKSALARQSNKKVDKGFKDWNDNVKKRDSAIELGKKTNEARIAYEKDKSNKALKSTYKDLNKQYKKSLSRNTTYRKGAIRQEVGRDASRKYLSEAKKIKTQLDNDPSNKQLQKKYNELMSKHDIERASARKASDVGAKRSRRKAAFKRTITMSVKMAATTAAVTAGAYAVNKYLADHQVTLNGERVTMSKQNISDLVGYAKKVKDFMGYVY